MKTHTLKFAMLPAILLMLAGEFMSCKDNVKVCNVENPLTDLPWLKQVINEREKDAETGNKQHARIYQCIYRDGIGFLLELCVDCPDFGYELRSCEGESLCVMWGFAGNSCAEYGVDFENKKLIWEINN